MSNLEEKRNFRGSRRDSLLKMLTRIVAVVFLCEFLVMYGLQFLKIESTILETLIDCIALSFLISPFIWFFVIRSFEKERDKAVNQLESNYETMIHVSRMTTLGEVSKGLAHEINNPLQIITGAGQVIGRSSDEKVAQWGNRITESGRRIAKILRGLLIFTGVEGVQKGKVVPIHEAFSDFQDFILSRLEEKSVLLKIYADREVLACCRR